MESPSWIENTSLSGVGETLITLPSIGHIFALLTVILLWKIPRAQAFDPNRHSNSKSAPNPMFAPPPPPGPPPRHSSARDPPAPPARALSEWDTASSCGSDDSQSVSEASACSEQDVSKAPVPQEPSYFMKSECPDSTPAERHRFLVARDGNEEAALKNLQAYTGWRKQYEFPQKQQEERHYNLQFDDYDLYDWIVASQTALNANGEARQGWQWLSRVIRTHTLPNGQTAVDRDGSRIIHMIPAQIDDEICSLETYSLAIVLYLNRKVHRDDLEKVTILMDLRPGEGWRNISAVRLLPFIKSMVGLTLKFFPERLCKSVLYPLPWALSWVFNAVKAVIDPVTASKLVVLSGGASQNSPLPLDQLTQYVTKDVALMCENERLASFSC